MLEELANSLRGEGQAGHKDQHRVALEAMDAWIQHTEHKQKTELSRQCKIQGKDFRRDHRAGLRRVPICPPNTHTQHKPRASLQPRPELGGEEAVKQDKASQ